MLKHTKNYLGEVLFSTHEQIHICPNISIHTHLIRYTKTETVSDLAKLGYCAEWFDWSNFRFFALLCSEPETDNSVNHKNRFIPNLNEAKAKANATEYFRFAGSQKRCRRRVGEMCGQSENIT